jgi:DNA-binding IclR family transcriptional regulator
MAQADKPHTITDISQSLGIPKSSAFILLHTLVAKRYLEIEDAKLKTFKLGFKLYQTGVSYLSGSKLIKVAHPVLEELMEKVRQTVFMAVEDEGHLVFIDLVETASPVITTTRLGRSRKPMYTSGLGKALLATYTESRVRQIVGEGAFNQFTKNTIRNVEALFVELERTRRRRYAFDNQEATLGIVCVAVPVYDHTNSSVAAISIASPAHIMDNRKKQEFADRIREASLEISRQMGYLGEQLFRDLSR